MEEFDLNAIWKNSDKEASDYYDQLEGEVMRMARQRSSNIIQRMKQNALIELIAGIALWIGLFFFFAENPLIGYLLGGGILLYLGTGYSVYRMLKKFRSINTKNVKESVAGYLQLFRKSYQRTKILLYIVMPIGYTLGFMMGFIEAGGDWSDMVQPWTLLIILGVSAVVLGVIVWFVTRKYMHWMYGQYIEELQEVHDNLSAEGLENSSVQ
ncbi:MAG: hypothetical protein HRU41_01265 [Saprospiraceae bacterium]|nr:hypothetical protein [Saprospiraceae bacterium]